MRAHEFLVELNQPHTMKLYGYKLFMKWVQYGSGEVMDQLNLPDPDPSQYNSTMYYLNYEKLSQWQDGNEDDTYNPELYYKKYKDQIDMGFFNYLTKCDPTPKKKYIHWLIQLFLSGDINDLTDLYDDAKPLLIQYDKYVRNGTLAQMNPPQDDIHKIKSLAQLLELINNVDTTKENRKQILQQEFYDSGDAKLLLDNELYNVTMPETLQAHAFFASYYNKGGWCIATSGLSGQKYWDECANEPLVIIRINEIKRTYMWNVSEDDDMEEDSGTGGKSYADINDLIDDHPTLEDVLRSI